MGVCHKIPFGTRGEAKAYARHVKARGDGHALTPYLCERCARFHLSSLSRQQARRKGYRYR